MQSSTGTATTEQGSRYLQQLCKHWSHKAEVSLTPEKGEITFPSGNSLTLQALAGKHEMQATVPEGGDLVHFQDVVDRHLLRFAFREDLAIIWT